jgi:hypothetical protein
MIFNEGVMSRRLAARRPRLAQTASLRGATVNALQAFWTSCRLLWVNQSILKEHCLKPNGL